MYMGISSTIETQKGKQRKEERARPGGERGTKYTHKKKEDKIISCKQEFKSNIFP